MRSRSICSVVLTRDVHPCSRQKAEEAREGRANTAWQEFYRKVASSRVGCAAPLEYVVHVALVQTHDDRQAVVETVEVLRGVEQVVSVVGECPQIEKSEDVGVREHHVVAHPVAHYFPAERFRVFSENLCAQLRRVEHKALVEHVTNRVYQGVLAVVDEVNTEQTFDVVYDKLVVHSVEHPRQNLLAHLLRHAHESSRGDPVE